MKVLGLWPLVDSLLLLPVCVSGGSSGGTRDFMVGCPLSAAAVLSCTAQADRWVAGLRLILLLGLSLIMNVGLVVFLSRFDFLLSGLLLGYLLLIRVGGLSLWRFEGSGRLMMIVCSSCPGTMLFS